MSNAWACTLQELASTPHVVVFMVVYYPPQLQAESETELTGLNSGAVLTMSLTSKLRFGKVDPSSEPTQLKSRAHDPAWDLSTTFSSLWSPEVRMGLHNEFTEDKQVQPIPDPCNTFQKSGFLAPIQGLSGGTKQTGEANYITFQVLHSRLELNELSNILLEFGTPQRNSIIESWALQVRTDRWRKYAPKKTK
ncbi:hypothetical protein C8R44DRAFT_747874 [Mycena epipterygia]|nr:hypothetical protein C8R44DRAFT_747874 [Mycena epipterygia]